ncbi:MAG TPA: NifB/NifX family molybdenum-iron cluster-binding protein [Thermodesulfovibrionia bacterium]|nr:NifB/NifX family molybdenum-iron cluster-binding protein [Thermodesulfovibrionia bacterium]
MKICFPVQKDEGIESKVYDHFGSASLFVIVDTDTMDIVTIANQDEHHTHGACNPVRALNGHKVSSIVVGGIGSGALHKLMQHNIRVFQTQAPTVKENLMLLQNKSLPEFTLQHTCMGHEHGGGCAHY